MMGSLVLVVQSVGKKQIAAEVITGGALSSHKGINLPGVSMGIPAFTEKDAEDLEFGLSQQSILWQCLLFRQQRMLKKVREIGESRWRKQSSVNCQT